MNILAIDPGNVNSGWCLMDSESLEPINFDITENRMLLPFLHREGALFPPDRVVIERVSSYGMPVGREVFETCEWVGRFSQYAEMWGLPVDYIYRREEKLHICRDSKASDANIRRALIDRFYCHDAERGKGTKDDPDWFYGFRGDTWSAYAVGLTYIETKLQKEEDRPE